MPLISLTRLFNDTEVLDEADLEAFLDDIETFLNVTGIDDTNIQNAGITGSDKLVNLSVSAAKLAADSVTTTKIADANVTAAKLGASAVETAKINDLAVTTAKINDLAVTAAKLGASAVETAKINDSAVTTAKINDGAVTRAKLSAAAYSTSTHSATISSTGSTSNVTSSMTLSSRPVYLHLLGGSMDFNVGGGGVSNLVVTLERSDGTTIATLVNDAAAGAGTYTLSIDTPGSDTFTITDITTATALSPVQRLFVDTTGASGSFTYRVKATYSAASFSLDINSWRILAVEL